MLAFPFLHRAAIEQLEAQVKEVRWGRGCKVHTADLHTM